MNERAAFAFRVAGLVAAGAAGLYFARRHVENAERPAFLGPSLDELGPPVIDAGPLRLPTVAPFTAPPTLFERVTTGVVDAFIGLRRAMLPRGIRNNNPGNIRTLPANRAWRGQVGDDRGYGIYDEMASGVRALAKQLLVYDRRGLNTVRAIIETWAPATGRDPVTGKTYTQATPAYVAAVTRALAIGADVRFSVSDRLPELAAAIIEHENGDPFESYAAPALNRNYTRDELARWLRLP